VTKAPTVCDAQNPQNSERIAAAAPVRTVHYKRLVRASLLPQRSRVAALPRPGTGGASGIAAEPRMEDKSLGGRASDVEDKRCPE